MVELALVVLAVVAVVVVVVVVVVVAVVAVAVARHDKPSESLEAFLPCRNKSRELQ